MKKRLIISLIIFLLCISILIGCYVIIKGKNVEKFSNIQIVDCYEKEIENYKENKKSFTINVQNKKQKIKVNGKKYENNERFYEVGEYKIESIQGLKKEVATININDIDNSKKQEYDIYITTSTLPTFMAMLDMAGKDEVQGFFWTQRATSLNLDSIKNHTKKLKISEYIGNSKEYDFKTKVIPEIKEYIKNVLEKDEDAYFNLYVDDYRFYLDVELFGKIGLGDNRYTYYLYTDGTSSYTTDFKIGNIYSHKEYRIREKDSYNDFEKEKNDYFELIDKIRSNQYQYNNMPGSYMVEDDGDTYIYDYMLLAALRKNVKFMIQFPQLIHFEDERVAEEMKEANFIKIDLREQYQNLSMEGKEILLESIKLNKNELDKEYFVDENSTKYLIITGTKPYYGDFTQKDFEKIIKDITEKYGKDYTILYKPHPSEIPDEEKESFLNSINIKVLPGKIPIEAIMFVYPTVKIGGFVSSLYLSAEEGQTLFFFAENKEKLVTPLNDLYDSVFYNAEFYN